MESSDFVRPGGARTYWERVATTKWGAYTTDVEKRGILKAHSLSGKPTVALEIGCEGGRWSKLLTDLGWQMTCTDIDEGILAICKQRIPTANCILVNPHDVQLPLASESVDLILCVEVNPVIQSSWFIDEAFRVLGNGKLVVGLSWNMLSLRGLFSHMVDLLRNGHDWYKTVYPFWRRKLRDVGFHILYEEGFCWFPFHRASDSVLVPFFVALEEKLGLRKLAAISPWILFVAQKQSSFHLEKYNASVFLPKRVRI
jgi:SAM-dependent methyltransferase